jgi:hypothetical protein
MSAEMWIVHQKAEFVLWYAEMKLVCDPAESFSHEGINACE